MFSDLLSRIRARMQSQPDAPALITRDGVVSFGALERRCAGIRAHLASRPAGAVLITGHKEPACVAAMLACAFAGRGFVFADRSYPAGRIERMARTGATTSALLGPDTSAPEGVPATALDAIAEGGALGPADAVDDAALFYVIFTSGSTGTPKGIPISRANFAALDDWYGPQLASAPQGAHVNHSSLSFDMGMFDLWSPLAQGRPVILLDHRNNILPCNNVRHLQSVPGLAVASWASTPSLLQLMCAEPRFCADHFAELRFFVIGGEMLPRPLIRELMRRFPEAVLLNGYGPSEATCCTHLRALSCDDLEAERPLPLGAPCGRTGMRIVDEAGEPVGDDVPGELELFGPQVVSGYLPADHPANRAFGQVGGQRSYRTGDLGRIDAQGHLVLMGRTDRQVKWLGNRIELNEIERVADEFPGLSRSACVPQREEARVVGLILFVQPEPERTVVREPLLAHLARHLPPGMIPRDIRVVSQMPVTVNGKTDTGKLLADIALAAV
ncbi:MAG: AMP-binding protein [Paenirhodobacter sp.]|uniref:AMP-binding protein n=1 Tax=Paenirhodobacter sp. TaxID=1965326 RepID=UPI003D0F348D